MAKFFGYPKSPKSMYVLLALILGAFGSIPLVVLTPPFQVPDEAQHFYRAYELSDLEIHAEVQNGVSGAMLPESLPRLVKSCVYTSDDLNYPATPAPISGTLKLTAIPLDSSAKRFVGFPGSAFYSPLPYLPQVLGIAIGRMVGLGPLYLLYLGRLFNCLAALGLVGLAVYVIPFAEELVILVACLPMSLFLYASISADSAVIASAIVFTAFTLSASARGDWKAWELAVAASTAAVFCSVKPVYFPIILAGLIPNLFRPGRAKGAIRSHLILIAVSLGVTIGWLLFARSSMTSPLGDGHPSIQMNIVMHDPMLLVHAVANGLGFKHYFQLVGVFGWLTVPIRPIIVYLGPVASLAIVLATGKFGAP